jgi:metal-responsive CopG/Arc/MetJ family transcriptional regulator
MKSELSRRDKKEEPDHAGKLVRITISVDEKDYAEIGRLSQRSRLSRSWLIRKAMREFLNRNTSPDIKFVRET